MTYILVLWVVCAIVVAFRMVYLWGYNTVSKGQRRIERELESIIVNQTAYIDRQYGIISELQSSNTELGMKWKALKQELYALKNQ